MPGPQPQRVLRIAHLTDMHVQANLHSVLGFELVLEHALSEGPDVVFTGGDHVMDSLEHDLDSTKQQWDAYLGIAEEITGVPVEPCLGNHDVWGWGLPDRYSKEPDYGKKLALDRLGMERPYRSFDRAGWHFVVLDSTHSVEGVGYTAKLDEEQFEWLADDLERTPTDTPVLVLSHIPILAMCPFLDGDNEQSGDWQVPGAWMHIDARRIKDLFLKHPNVKACLSGHIHLADEVSYLGVKYFCNGAVCGAWWKGPYQECGNGYAVVDLFADGTLDNRYVDVACQPIALGGLDGERP